MGPRKMARRRISRRRFKRKRYLLYSCDTWEVRHDFSSIFENLTSNYLSTLVKVKEEGDQLNILVKVQEEDTEQSKAEEENVEQSNGHQF